LSEQNASNSKEVKRGESGRSARAAGPPPIVFQSRQSLDSWPIAVMLGGRSWRFWTRRLPLLLFHTSRAHCSASNRRSHMGADQLPSRQRDRANPASNGLRCGGSGRKRFLHTFVSPYFHGIRLSRAALRPPALDSFWWARIYFKAPEAGALSASCRKSILSGELSAGKKRRRRHGAVWVWRGGAPRFSDPTLGRLASRTRYSWRYRVLISIFRFGHPGYLH